MSHIERQARQIRLTILLLPSLNMPLDSPVATAFFVAMMSARLLAASWLVVPELAPIASPYPELSENMDQFRLERFVHGGNALMYAFLIYHYSGKPKLFNYMNFGSLLVVLCMHHIFEHLTHELLPKEGIMTLVGNTVWTSFTVCVYHVYAMKYGYYNVFYRLAGEPFFVFMAVSLEIIETHAGFGCNWTIGSPMLEDDVRTGYPTVAAGFTERALLFGGINVLLGVLVQQYFKIHKEAAAMLVKTGGD
jgi:hypothetical protein